MNPKMENEKIDGSEPTTEPPRGRPSEGGPGQRGSYDQRTQGGYGPQQPYYQSSYYSGWGYHYPPTAVPPEKVKPKRTGKPKVVGALLITAGLLTMIFAGVMGGFLVNVGPWSDSFPFDSSEWNDDIGGLHGTVIYQNSTPAANATITVMDSGKFATSDASGFYRILGVPSGWRDIKVEKAGYTTVLQSIYISGTSHHNEQEAEEAEADFQLQPGSGVMRIGKEHEPGESDVEEWGMGMVRGLMAACLVLSVAFGAITMLAGYYATHRRNLAFVVVGSVLGILSIGFGIGALLSLIALIILFLCMDEFNGGKGKGGTKKGEGKKGRKGRRGADRMHGPMAGGAIMQQPFDPRLHQAPQYNTPQGGYPPAPYPAGPGRY